MMYVIANSTPLIALSKIHELKILKEIYNQIVIPKAVYEEVAILGKGREGSAEITKAKRIEENIGRRIAKMFGLKVTGTIGTIIEAKKGGLLNNVQEKLDALINVGFWIGEDLYVEALRLSGELER